MFFFSSELRQEFIFDSRTTNYYTFQDFGGQNYYRAFHSFAITSDSIFLILYDLRHLVQLGRHYVEGRLEYYLSTIRAKFLATENSNDNLKVLLVGNYEKEAQNLEKEFSNMNISVMVEEMVQSIQNKYDFPKISPESLSMLIDADNVTKVKKVARFLDSISNGKKRGQNKQKFLALIRKYKPKNSIVRKELFNQYALDQVTKDTTILGDENEETLKCRIKFLLNQFIQNGYLLEFGEYLVLDPKISAEIFFLMLFNIDTSIQDRQTGNIVYEKEAIFQAFDAIVTSEDQKNLMFDVFVQQNLTYRIDNSTKYVIPSLLLNVPPIKVTQPSKTQSEINQKTKFEKQWIFKYSYLHPNIWNRFIGDLTISFHPQYQQYLWINGILAFSESETFVLMIQFNPKFGQVMITIRSNDTNHIEKLFQNINKIEQEIREKEKVFTYNIELSKFCVDKKSHFHTNPKLHKLEICNEEYSPISMVPLFQNFQNELFKSVSNNHVKVSMYSRSFKTNKVCDYKVVLVNDFGSKENFWYVPRPGLKDKFWPDELFNTLSHEQYKNGKFLILDYSLEDLKTFSLEQITNNFLESINELVGECPFFLFSYNRGNFSFSFFNFYKLFFFFLIK